MAYTPKDNTGTLFRNERREKDTHPNAKGTALIDGVEYWVSAWTKSSDKGNFQSLSFQRKEKKDSSVQDYSFPEQTAQPSRQTKANFHDDLDGDSIPFHAEFR